MRRVSQSHSGGMETSSRSLLSGGARFTERKSPNLCSAFSLTRRRRTSPSRRVLCHSHPLTRVQGPGFSKNSGLANDSALTIE